MKKALLIILTLTLTTAFAFAGGQQGEQSSAARELTVWEGLWANAAVSVTTLADTPLYKEAMRRTNINVTWIHPPQGQENENFNLMIASNELPDIMYRNWTTGYPGGAEKAIADGVIIKLNEQIENDAPNLWSLFQKNPDWLTAAKTDEGTLYSFPFIRGHEDLMVFYGPQLRKDWLDELDLEVPTTLAEWENVLTIMKSSGRSEYPLSFTKFGKGRGLESAGGAFIQPFGTTWDFHKNDAGQVQFGPYKDEFGEFLAFFSEWYQNGLVDPEFFSNERKTFDAKVVNGDIAAWTSYTGSGIGAYMDANRGRNDAFDIIGVPYPVLNKGDTPFFGQRDTADAPSGRSIVHCNSRHPLRRFHHSLVVLCECRSDDQLLRRAVPGLVR